MFHLTLTSRSIAIVFFISLLLVLNINAAPVEEPSADQLLDQMQTAADEVSYAGKRMVAVWLTDRTISHEERIAHLANGKHLVLADDPLMREPRNGPPFGRFAQLRIEKDLLLKNYQVDVTPGDKVAGRTTYLLHIVSHWEARPSKKLWLDRETGVVIRAEHYDAEGNLRSMFVFSHITYDVDRVNEIMSAMEKSDRRGRGRPPARDRGEHEGDDRNNRGRGDRHPSWTRVDDPALLQKVVNDKIKLLDPVPEGFKLLHGEWLKMDRDTHVQLRYVDGLTALSLFQSKRSLPFWRRPPGPSPDIPVQEFEVSGTRVRLIDGGIIRILNWSKDDRYFTLMGELGQAVTIPLVRSMIENP